MGPGAPVVPPSQPICHTPTLQPEARGSCSRSDLNVKALDPTSNPGQRKKQRKADAPGLNNATPAAAPQAAGQDPTAQAAGGNAAADTPLPGDGASPLSAGGHGRSQAGAPQGLPPPASSQRFLRPFQLSSAQRMLVQLSCTSEPVLERLVAAMQPEQRQRFQSEQAALELGGEGTRQKVQRTYSLLRQVAGMCPEGEASKALKQHVKAECQELTKQQEEQLAALGAQQLLSGS